MKWSSVTPMQYVKQNEDNVFEVLNIVKMPKNNEGAKFRLQHHTIDTAKLSNSELVNVIKEYGYVYIDGALRDDNRNIVEQEVANQIIAEYVSEMQTKGFLVEEFGDTQQLAVYLKNKYDIYLNFISLHFAGQQ